MAYKFTGRIKKIGIQDGKNFCEFDVDNSIIIKDKEYGVAVNENKQLDIVEEVTGVDTDIFSLFQSCKDERFEIYYEYYVVDKEGKEKLAKTKNSKNATLKIKKVTVIK